MVRWSAPGPREEGHLLKSIKTARTCVAKLVEKHVDCDLRNYDTADVYSIFEDDGPEFMIVAGQTY